MLEDVDESDYATLKDELSNFTIVRRYFTTRLCIG